MYTINGYSYGPIVLSLRSVAINSAWSLMVRSIMYCILRLCKWSPGPDQAFVGALTSLNWMAETRVEILHCTSPALLLLNKSELCLVYFFSAGKPLSPRSFQRLVTFLFSSKCSSWTVISKVWFPLSHYTCFLAANTHYTQLLTNDHIIACVSYATIRMQIVIYY